MLKRLTAYIAIFFLISAAAITFDMKLARAYQNLSYQKPLRVQLKSMSSPAMTVILSGSYKLNNLPLQSGTILKLNVGETGIWVDGISYSELQLVPDNLANTSTINNGIRELSYLGNLDFKIEGPNIMVYNTIDMENYLKGVVPYEMSNSYPLEALKAQAVAARNFALKKIGTRASYGYDFDDTILFQVYGGYNPSYANAIKAVDVTRGVVLLYNNELVEALYSASHGGYSEASENVWGNYSPYLRAKADSYENDSWPYGDILLTAQEIEAKLKTKGYIDINDMFIRLDLDNISRFESGRINSIPVIYRNTEGVEFVRYISKDSARTFLSFPSSMYTISYDMENNLYRFSGKGYGHGLGMSQVGAKNRANSGQTFQDILAFYYSSTQLANVATAPTQEGLEPSSASPKIELISGPKSQYNLGEVITINVNTPTYSQNVEYRVIIYNGSTKTSTQLYNSPSTSYYNRSLQQIGLTDYKVNIPSSNITPGTYSLTILTRKAGTSVAYDSHVTTNSFRVLAPITSTSRSGTTLQIPKLVLNLPPKTEYKTGEIISLNVSSPNYGGKVEYRVILYNGMTKKTSELWKTPLTGYYYKSWQPSGNYNFNIHWPVAGMEPGPYSITVLVRRAGSKTAYDSYIKTNTIWIKN